jgi:PAS domain S-box-containing protein
MWMPIVRPKTHVSDESPATAVIITNREGIIEWVSPSLLAKTGYAIEEVLGHRPGELIKSGVHDTAFYRALWSTILNGHVWHGRIVNRGKDGSQFEEETTITPLIGVTGEITHFLAVKRAVTTEANSGIKD